MAIWRENLQVTAQCGAKLVRIRTFRIPVTSRVRFRRLTQHAPAHLQYLGKQRVGLLILRWASYSRARRFMLTRVSGWRSPSARWRISSTLANKWLGRRVLTLSLVESRHIRDAGQHIRMVLAQSMAPQFE